MKHSSYHQYSRARRGFTFTEILIVLAIIAGVTVLVLSQADAAVGSSEISRAAGDIRQLVTAANQYRALKSTFTDINSTRLIDLGLIPDGMLNDDGLLVGPYHDSASKHAYGITSLSNGRAYGIAALLADTGSINLDGSVIEQLHEAFGGTSNACNASAATVTSAIFAAGLTADWTCGTYAAGSAATWAREFNK